MKRLSLRTLAKWTLAAICCLSLTGCLSHYFVETSSRLQVKNTSDDCTLVEVDVFDEEGESALKWIEETVLPGERSHVVEKDWVGEFTFRVKYTKSTDGTGDVLEDLHKMEIEGGSIFMEIGSDGDSLTYRIR